MESNAHSRLTSHHFIAVLPAAQAVYQWREIEFVNLIRTAVRQAQLTIVGEAAFSFTPAGVSAVALLAESHIALHFWPEYGKVTVDIHICDYSDRNRKKAEILAQQITEKLSPSPDPTLKQWQQFSAQG